MAEFLSRLVKGGQRCVQIPKEVGYTLHPPLQPGLVTAQNRDCMGLAWGWIAADAATFCLLVCARLS